MSILASNNVFPHDPDDNWKLKTDKGGCELTAQEIVNKIDELEFPDDILVRGAVIKTENVLSISALAFTCRIDKNVITNQDDFSTTIVAAAEGSYRIDILVFTKFGTIVKIQGPEGTEDAQKPDVPVDTIEISFVSVFGSIIGDPEIPIENGFITKASKGFIRMFYTGNVDFVPVDDKSFLKFEVGMLSLKSLQIDDPNNFYFGKYYVIYNSTALPVTLFHNEGTGNFKFNFPNGNDLVIKPEENVLIVMRALNSSNNGGLLNLVGNVVDLSNKADLVAGKVPWWQLPSYVDDILEGYLLSNVFYNEVGHTTVIPAETGKVYIDITTGQKNKQYRFSGSVYTQITNGLIASSDDVLEGAVNKYSTLALVMSYVLTGISFASGAAITAGDNILSGFGKLQKQITDLIASVALKASSASPTFTGTPIAPTATAGNNTTQVATTAFVTGAMGGAVLTTTSQNVMGIKTFPNTTFPQDSGIVMTDTSSSSSSALIKMTITGTSSGVNISGTSSTNMSSQVSAGGVAGTFRVVGTGTALTITSNSPSNAAVTVSHTASGQPAIDVNKSGSSTGSCINCTQTGTGDYLSGSDGTVTNIRLGKTGIITAVRITGAIVNLKQYTVATLPAGTLGDTAFVTDAVTPTYLGALTGGGAIRCPVFFNGSGWVSH